MWLRSILVLAVCIGVTLQLWYGISPAIGLTRETETHFNAGNVLINFRVLPDAAPVQSASANHSAVSMVAAGISPAVTNSCSSTQGKGQQLYSTARTTTAASGAVSNQLLEEPNVQRLYDYLHGMTNMHNDLSSLLCLPHKYSGSGFGNTVVGLSGMMVMSIAQTKRPIVNPVPGFSFLPSMDNIPYNCSKTMPCHNGSKTTTCRIAVGNDLGAANKCPSVTHSSILFQRTKKS
jgi:hypothetical protein